jgi:hypothetical protein
MASYLSDGVGAGAVGEGGGSRAVGDERLDDLGHDGDVGASHGAGGEGKDSSSSELHFVGIKGDSEELN